MGKYLFLSLVCLMWAQRIGAQSVQRTQLLDASTHLPVAFANVAFGHTGTGTVSDINGVFEVDLAVVADTLQISCLGYVPMSLSKNTLAGASSLLLSPTNIELSAVDVFPGINPALPIMEKVVANIPSNNPDAASDYKCSIYHKMVFRYHVNDSMRYHGPISPKTQNAIDDHYLLLMESVSEKSHLAPNKSSEKIIVSRVSGFKDPSLALIPVQIQPFVFYGKYIKLLDDEYLNPVSEPGLGQYSFCLEDTLIDERGDTLFYISYMPKRQSNILGLKGAFHVHAPTWAIKSVSATSTKSGGNVGLSIRQFYKLVDGNRWFPDQLESSLLIKPKKYSSGMPYPIVAEGKSYVASVNLEPRFAADDFSMFSLTDNSQRPQAPAIDGFRFVPLTAKDSATYLKIDSIGRQKNLDNLLTLQKNLLDGYIPIGALKLDYRKLADFTSFEGLKLGIGLWTSDKISPKWSTGGYFVHGFSIHQNNYGVGAKLNVWQQMESSIHLDWRDEFAEIGTYSFVDGFKVRSPESFRKFLSETMDRRKELRFVAQSRIAKGLKGSVGVAYGESDPWGAYAFQLDQGVVSKPFSSGEAIVKWRFQPQESLSLSSMGVFSEGSPFPTVWLNYANGWGTESAGFGYSKLEMQMEHRFKVSSAQNLTMRLVGAGIWGDCPPSVLYSSFGTYKHIGVDIPHAFTTMRMNEFAASRFTVASFVYDIAFNLNSPKRFKPVLELTSKAGWADFQGNKLIPAESVAGFEKGYWESGIAFKRLLGTQFVQYGAGVHYRYGPYAYNKWQQNMAIVFCVEFVV